MNELGKLIIKKRNELKISQRELARRIKIDNAYISRIEKGEIKKPSVKILMSLSEVLNLNFLKLLYMTYDPQEIEVIGYFNNINDYLKLIDESKFDNIKIEDENGNIRYSIIKLLNAYKKDEIVITDVLGILSCMTNKNFYDFLSEEEIKNINKKR